MSRLAFALLALGKRFRIGNGVEAARPEGVLPPASPLPQPRKERPPLINGEWRLSLYSRNAIFWTLDSNGPAIYRGVRIAGLTRSVTNAERGIAG